MEDVTIWPQITYICITAIGFAVAALKHGEPSKHNFFAWLISFMVAYTLLYVGGFWNPLL